jgi:hypothetical protein
VEERRGGYLGVPKDASQTRSSIDWDQLTLKKGYGGGRKMKVRDQTTRDKGGDHRRQPD